MIVKRGGMLLHLRKISIPKVVILVVRVLTNRYSNVQNEDNKIKMSGTKT